MQWLGERRPLHGQFADAERAGDWRGNSNIAQKRYLPTYHDASWVDENFGDGKDAQVQVAFLLE